MITHHHCQNILCCQATLQSVHIHSFLTLDYDASNGLTLNYISLILSHNPCCISLCFSLARSLKASHSMSYYHQMKSTFPVIFQL